MSGTHKKVIGTLNKIKGTQFGQKGTFANGTLSRAHALPSEGMSLCPQQGHKDGDRDTSTGQRQPYAAGYGLSPSLRCDAALEETAYPDVALRQAEKHELMRIAAQRVIDARKAGSHVDPYALKWAESIVKKHKPLGMPLGTGAPA